jgi:hypothetical protein
MMTDNDRVDYRDPMCLPRVRERLEYRDEGYSDGRIVGMILGFFLGAVAMAFVFLLFVR